MTDSANWYTLQVTPMYEKLVMQRILQLRDNGISDKLIDCKMITQIVNKPAKNRKGEDIVKEVEEKLYPCYLFVKMIYDLSLVHLIRNLTGVTRWVGTGFLPTPLSDAEIKDIPGLEEPLDDEYFIGKSYKVNSGLFEGCSGKLTNFDTNKNIGQVVIHIFGRDTTIEVELSSLSIIL